jgi:hypothetical protein
VTDPRAVKRALPAIRRLGRMVAVAAAAAVLGAACHSSTTTASPPTSDSTTTVTTVPTTTTTTLRAGPLPGNPKGVATNATAAVSDFDNAIGQAQSALGTSESILTTSAQTVQAAIATRQGIVSTLQARVKSSPYLTAADRSSLQATLAQASNGLATALATDGGTASNVSAAARLASSLAIVSVVQPQVLFTIASEDALHVAAGFAAIAAPLTTYFTALSQQGQNVFAVTADLSEIKSVVVDTQTALARTPAILLAIKLGDPNGRPTLGTTVRALTTARTSVGKGLDALSAINRAFS